MLRRKILESHHIILHLVLSRNSSCQRVQPNLICFKNWTADMVMHIISSAINLKQCMKQSNMERLDLLKDLSITMILEVNEPLLKLAVSQGSHMLGARTNSITDNILFDQHYMGRVFSLLSDMLVVCAKTHMCVERFSQHARVPVVCVRSRVHQTLHALAAIMTVQEEYKSLKRLTIGYVGRPVGVLNSYLLLCPMLGINFKFYCCCQTAPVHPVLFKAASDMCLNCGTDIVACQNRDSVLRDCNVIISGPAKDISKPLDGNTIFDLNLRDIKRNSVNWIYIHTLPRGPEVDDELFNHKNSRTLDTIGNLSYVAAAIMASSLKNYLF